MPITKSAKKALRQSVRRRARNLVRLDAIRTATKQFKKHVAAGDAKAARALLPKLQKALDKAAQRNVITKNEAARKKARFAASIRRVNAK